MHVNETFIHTTYIDRTIVERGIVANPGHVAYNGGPDGIQHQPTAEERTASSEKHTPPTSVQTQHITAARADKSSYAKANGGHPKTLAVAKPLTPAEHTVAPAAKTEAKTPGKAEPKTVTKTEPKTESKAAPKAESKVASKPAVEPKDRSQGNCQNRVETDRCAKARVASCARGTRCPGGAASSGTPPSRCGAPRTRGPSRAGFASGRCAQGGAKV